MENKIDTSAAAVEILARDVCDRQRMRVFGGAITKSSAEIMRALAAERDALRAEVERLRGALQASVAFADGVADELDIEMSETVFAVRVMPSGKEVSARSWANVQDEARAALKSGDV